MAQTSSDSNPLFMPFNWWALWSPHTWNPQGPTALERFSQPILPGWTFGNVITVNERNSSSPETEREIVSEESYGRQLGRLMEAVAVLIKERPQDLPPHREFDDLLELSEAIDARKKRCAASRVRRVQAELRQLRRERPDDYRRIAAEIAQDIDADSKRTDRSAA